MKKIILICQLIVCFVLVFLILIQQRGSLIFSRGEFFLKRRGLEKLVFNLTILFSLFFISLSLINLLVK